MAKGSALSDSKQSEGVAVFSIELRDLVGDEFVGKCRVEPSMTCDGSAVYCSMKEEAGSSRMVEFSRSKAGLYQLQIKVDDCEVFETPLSFRVSERQVNVVFFHVVFFFSFVRNLLLGPRVRECFASSFPRMKRRRKLP